MNKENNRSAAGLRRSAIAERIRLREEWSALKGTDNATTSKKKKQTVINVLSSKSTASRRKILTNSQKDDNENFMKEMKATSEVLHGVVALVEVGAENRALALRAALAALGATVVPSWTPIVTHLVWSQGGCCSARARARALASRVVSPLWVEACAVAGARLPEQTFPAAARASDLPSPRTLRIMLKKADMENIPIGNLLSESEENELKPARLRLSSETEHDTSADTSRDKSRDTTKSTDTSRNITDVESRVNTAPRRAVPKSMSTPRPRKSKRKLFTQRDADITKDTDESDQDKTPVGPKHVNLPQLTHKERRDLARAERMARRLVSACMPATTQKVAQKSLTPRIVLTGMDRTERHTIHEAIRALNGRVQSSVNKRTTHVLLGSFRANNEQCTGVMLKQLPGNKSKNNDVTVTSDKNTSVVTVNLLTGCIGNKKARTFNALAGAARGARVLYAQWVIDSLEAKHWLHHYGYEVPHLKKISLKARVERTALGKSNSEYSYDIFSGMRVLLKTNAEQRDAAKQLLELCGAVVQDGGSTQNGGNFDITVGAGGGEVCSKWVFDSVASARMRTVRRYVINELSGRSVATLETIVIS